VTPEERKILDEKIVAINKQIEYLQSAMNKLDQFKQVEEHKIELLRIEQEKILYDYEQQSLTSARRALLLIPPPPPPLSFWLL
jgi:hypothetical protein